MSKQTIINLMEKAAAGEPVYISTVRKIFQELSEKEKTGITAHLQMMDGEHARCFTFTFPRKGVIEGCERLVSDYIKAEVYNILSTLGGRKLTFYLDTADPDLRAAAEDVIDSFHLNRSRRERGGYGRCINVIDRMLSALEGTESSFVMEIRDIKEMPRVEDFRESLRADENAFTRSLTALGGKRILGIDVGGTDIKIALAGSGELLCMKEYDWFPALFRESVQLVTPIVLLTRLLSVWQAVYLSPSEIPPEKKTLLESAMKQEADEQLIRQACDELEPFIRPGDALFDGIGLCFPDVVVNDKIVGGEVYKTRGIRLNPEIDYEKDFRQLTDLNTALGKFCRSPEAVSMTNDGPMAAFTAAVEWAASGHSDLQKNGYFAHTLGTELGTGWVREDGSVPDIPLEVYNCIVDLGSYPEREFHPDDLRSVNNFNTNLPGTLQKFASQSGVFRLAMKYFPSMRPDLYQELRDKGFVAEMEADGESRLVVPSENPDMRKPFLEHMMVLPERENDEVNHRIWREIGESLGICLLETKRLLYPKTDKRILFGRLVKRMSCFEAMEEGAREVVPDIELEVADSGIAFTPLMKQLQGDPHFTVAQFAQAVGAIYFAIDGMIRKSLIQEAELS